MTEAIVKRQGVAMTFASIVFRIGAIFVQASIPLEEKSRPRAQF